MLISDIDSLISWLTESDSESLSFVVMPVYQGYYFGEEMTSPGQKPGTQRASKPPSPTTSSAGGVGALASPAANMSAANTQSSTPGTPVSSGGNEEGPGCTNLMSMSATFRAYKL